MKKQIFWVAIWVTITFLIVIAANHNVLVAIK